MRKRECPCVALEMDGNACDGCGNFKGPEAESGLRFEKDGVTFRAWRGMARAERGGKLLWSAMNVFTKRKQGAKPCADYVYDKED